MSRESSGSLRQSTVSHLWIPCQSDAMPLQIRSESSVSPRKAPCISFLRSANLTLCVLGLLSRCCRDLCKPLSDPPLPSPGGPGHLRSVPSKQSPYSILAAGPRGCHAKLVAIRTFMCPHLQSRDFFRLQPSIADTNLFDSTIAVCCK